MQRTKIQDVAALAGVSVSTVSRVVNNSDYPVTAEKRDRVRRAVRELNFSPSQVARNLRTNKSKLIALVVADIANPYFAGIARAMDEFLFHEGYGLIISSTDESPDREKGILNRLRDQDVDAIVISSSGQNISLLELLHKGGFPVMLLDRNIEELHMPFIGSDNVRECCILTQYLIDKGHRSILFLAGSLDSTTGKERLQGYRKALLKNRIEYDDSLVLHGNFMRDETYRLSVDFFDNRSDRATAVVSSNNLMSEGFLEAAFDRKIRIPQQYSLVSFGSIDNQRLITPILTCYRQNLEMIGKLTAQMTLQMINESSGNADVPQNLVINDVFVEGKSVGTI
ncbi:MAG: LacI family DNA-binding transcriptional regulator [Bifidobacterium sp.]|uniref:LacI family DNA-binding transcriptional regulator n=1 Tax=Bifidobacterium sp. TaxID=41200 RepID=UPI0039EA4F0B